MRILHIVTLISPGGEYGGPVRVALNQSAELIRRGHTVDIAAGTRGYTETPKHKENVPLKLFRVHSVMPTAGFAALAGPGLWAWVFLHAKNYDVIHVHLARDLVVLPAAALACLRGVPVVVQSHGMVTKSDKRTAKPLDALLTRKVLNKASMTLYLTETERADIRKVAGDDVKQTKLTNGIQIRHGLDRPEREPIDVLFLGRLHARKRPTQFVDMAIAILANHGNVRFSIVGPDEGELSQIHRRIESSQMAAHIQIEGPIEPEMVLQRMSKSSIYVLPSVDEPYPMSVIEAQSLGIPAVITKSCGLAELVGRHNSGIVTDESVEELIAAVKRLIEDKVLRASMSRNAVDMICKEFDIAAVVKRLESVYKNC
ncbi:glycosyltransferase [Rhodococcus sp. PML026]|uniref:glycosyltransferase n=1 Tax=Rhodococcus sp. PML026 TaxID=1356405 RepID=UPI0005F8301A|nr:glycosyltransferase [Rhodococcus sp. PML026]KJV03318.1 putative glycosyltransferase [Rhodococcus sp. PML026]